MKIVSGVCVTGFLFLIVAIGSNGTFAEDYSRYKEIRNRIGVKYSYLKFNDSTQFDAGSGFELYGMFDIQPSLSNPNHWSCEVFFGKYDTQTGTDFLSAGDLSMTSYGLGALYRKNNWRFGGGFISFTNKFEVTAAVKQAVGDEFAALVLAGYGEKLVSYTYEEILDDASGFYLKFGKEIPVTDNIDFSFDIKKTFVAADASSEFSARTYDSVWGLYYTYDVLFEEEIDIGVFSLSFGFAMRF